MAVDLDLSDPVTIGVIAGIGAALIVIVLVVCCCCCRKKCCRSRSRRSSSKQNSSSGFKPRSSSRWRSCSAKKQKGNTLDLHGGYSSKEAHSIFLGFLSTKKREYKGSNKKSGNRFINIITGRGNHSKDGVPVIKNNVGKFLKSNGYKHHEARHGGMVTIDLGT